MAYRNGNYAVFSPKVIQLTIVDSVLTSRRKKYIARAFRPHGDVFFVRHCYPSFRSSSSPTATGFSLYETQSDHLKSCSIGFSLLTEA